MIDAVGIGLAYMGGYFNDRPHAKFGVEAVSKRSVSAGDCPGLGAREG